jgi:hypothetical protein
VTLAATLLLAAVALSTGSDSRAEQLSLQQGKVSCPRGEVAVNYAGKRSCEPIGRALPGPTKGDERLAMLRTLVTSDWGSPPDLQGRRPPTIEALLADFGPAAAARVRKAIAEIPATADRLTPKAARFRALSSLSGAAAAPCGPPRGAPPKTDSLKQDLGNGSSFDLNLSIAAGKVTAGFGIEGAAKDGSDRRVRWDVSFDLCDENLAFSVPECPTADGKLNGSGKTSFTLKVTSMKAGKVEHSATVEIKHRATSKGTVAVDAKLDRVEIEDVYQSTLKSSGQSIFWGPSSETGTVMRTAWVDMRTGRYDLGRANVVDVQVSYTGILSIFTQDALAKARVAGELAKASDETFAKTVKHVIEEYRGRESAWQTPNTCATLEFTPASGTLRLQNRQTGTFKGSVRAKRGGTAADGRWRRVAQRNVSVSPARATGREPAFTYRVTNAERGVSARFRVTSPAGVAQDPWTQNTADLPPRFAGTFSGRTREEAGGVQTLDYSFSGTITFARTTADPRPGFVAYSIEKIDYRTTFTLGGMCRGTATESASMGKNDDPSNMLYLARDVTPQKGRRYEINFTVQRLAAATLRASCSGTTVVYPWAPVAQVITPPAAFYADARAARLRGTRNLQGTPITYTWDLRGRG